MANKEFLYFLEAKKPNGNRVKYPIYRDDKFYYIKDHKIKKGKDIEEEVKKLFNVEVVGPIFEKPPHQDLKFKE